MVGLMVVIKIWVADLEIWEVVVRHVVLEIDLKGWVANCSSLTHRGYLLTFVVEEVLECVLLVEKDFYGACGGERDLFLRGGEEFSHLVVHHLKIKIVYENCEGNVKKIVFEGDDYKNSRKDGPSLSSDDEDEEEVIEEETTLFPFSLLGFLKMYKGSMTRLWNVNLAKFNYKSRTNRFVKSEKRLEAYGLEGWKHVVFYNEGWSNEISFMKETLFKSTLRLPNIFIDFS
nr:hypothetical protein [Tanacetum cinerariifolium]